MRMSVHCEPVLWPLVQIILEIVAAVHDYGMINRARTFPALYIPAVRSFSTILLYESCPRSSIIGGGDSDFPISRRLMFSAPMRGIAEHLMEEKCRKKRLSIELPKMATTPARQGAERCHRKSSLFGTQWEASDPSELLPTLPSPLPHPPFLTLPLCRVSSSVSGGNSRRW